MSAPGAGEPAATPVAVVTGGSRGLGAVLTAYLLGAGFEVIAVARRRGPLTELEAELTRFRFHLRTLSADVAKPADRERIATMVRSSGRLDLLVNNASDLGEVPLPPLARASLSRLESVYRTNAVAPLALVQVLLPELKAARGLVVNISSDAARGGYSGWGAYGASKAALDLLSATLGRELASEGVSVVAVDPGDLRTEMHQAAFPGENISDRPLPDVTIPFWAWLLGQPPGSISGHRFQAQAERWEVTT